MNINKLKFETITTKDTSKVNKSPKPFGTIYPNKLFLGLSMTNLIQESFPDAFIKKEILKESIKYVFNVVMHIAENVLKIDFVKEPNENSIEGCIFKSNDGKYQPTWIGDTKLINTIAKIMDLDMSNNKFYPSIDYEIKDNSLYLEFNKDNYRFSKKAEYRLTKKSGYEKATDKISWDRDGQEFELSNLFCYVNSQYRQNSTLKELARLLGFTKNKDYYNTLGEIFSKTGDRARGHDITQIQNSFVKWEYHYIYTYTNGKHGLANGGRDEHDIKKFISKFEKIGMKNLIKQIKEILHDKNLNLK